MSCGPQMQSLSSEPRRTNRDPRMYKRRIRRRLILRVRWVSWWAAPCGPCLKLLADDVVEAFGGRFSTCPDRWASAQMPNLLGGPD